MNRKSMSRRLAQWKRENKAFARYASDVRLRIGLSLRLTFAFNAVYAAFQLGLGLRHRSVWFYTMFGYYLLLAMMRLLLIRHTKSHAPGAQQALEWRKYRLCGLCLMSLTLVLAVAITYFIFRIRVFRHHEITTIAMATYTFTSLTLAIINAVRYRSYGSPVYSAAKAISLVSAIISMLSLENTMLSVFGNDRSELFRQQLLGISGIAAVFAVQGIALHMIINAGRKLRAYRTAFRNPAHEFGRMDSMRDTRQE